MKFPDTTVICLDIAKENTYSTFWVGCPDRMLQSVIVKRLSPHGDVILVGKFVQMVVASANQLPIAMSGLDNRRKKYCIV